MILSFKNNISCPTGATAGGPVRGGHLPLRPRLLRAAAAPEDPGGGALRDRQAGGVQADGEGESTFLFTFSELKK